MGKLGLNSGYIGSDQRTTTNGVVGYDKFYLERRNGRFSPTLEYNKVPGYSLYLSAFNPDSYPGSGNTWYDLSGNGNDATLNNNPTWNANGYFDLDGTNDWVDAVAVGTLLDGAFTVEVGVWPTVDSYTGGPGGRVIWSTHNASYSNLYIYIVSPNTGQIGEISKRPITPNTSAGTIGQEWKLVTFVHDGSIMSIYIDGIFQGTQTKVQSNNNFFSIGQEYDGTTASDFYLGKLNEVTLYDYVLDSSNISQNAISYKERFS